MLFWKPPAASSPISRVSLTGTCLTTGVWQARKQPHNAPTADAFTPLNKPSCHAKERIKPAAERSTMKTMLSHYKDRWLLGSQNKPATLFPRLCLFGTVSINPCHKQHQLILSGYVRTALCAQSTLAVQRWVCARACWCQSCGFVTRVFVSDCALCSLRGFTSCVFYAHISALLNAASASLPLTAFGCASAMPDLLFCQGVFLG